MMATINVENFVWAYLSPSHQKPVCCGPSQLKYCGVKDTRQYSGLALFADTKRIHDYNDQFCPLLAGQSYVVEVL
jgi:hypothetical protein